jgi:hypothetical protein
MSRPVSAPRAAPQASTTVSAPIVGSRTPAVESLTLGRVLIGVAVVWGVIGIANIVDVYVKSSSDAMRSFGFFFGVLFFLFPSLAFFAWGASRNSRIKAASVGIWATSAGGGGSSAASGATGVQEMPVWQLSWYAMKLPFQKLPIFLQMVIVPLAISIALSLPNVFLARSPRAAVASLANRGGSGWVVILAIALALRLVVEIPFQVGWLRLVVLGDSSPRGRGYFRFDETEKRYLGYAFLLLVAFLPASASLVWFQGFPKGSPESGGAALVSLALLGLTASALVKLVFVLPAIATNRFESLLVSWNQTSGLGLRLFCVIATATFPLLMASSVLLEFGGAPNGFIVRLFAMAASVSVDYASRAALLAAVAIAYRDWGIRVDQAGGERVAAVA